MYVEVITHYPSIGKGIELQTLLLDAVRTAQSSGLRTRLTRNYFWSDGPSFKQLTVFTSLEEYQKQRQAQFASLEFWKQVEATTTLRRKPVSIQVYELISEEKPAQSPEQFTHIVFFMPLPGKEKEVRLILEETTKQYQSGERPRFRLLRELMPPDGGQVYLAVDYYIDLAEYQSSAFENRPAFVQEAMSKLNILCREPIRQEIHELLEVSGGTAFSAS